MARVLNDLRTERAQVGVDNRRAASSYADAVAGPSFDDAKAKHATTQANESSQRWNQAVADALRRIHALLDDDQRKAFALMVADSPEWFA